MKESTLTQPATTASKSLMRAEINDGLTYILQTHNDVPSSDRITLRINLNPYFRLTDKATSEYLILDIEKSKVSVHADDQVDERALHTLWVRSFDIDEITGLAKKLRNLMLMSHFVENNDVAMLSQQLREHIERTISAQPAKSLKTKPRLNSHQVTTVMDYIEDRFEDTIYLEELAALTELSTFYFCRAFKNMTGISPHQAIIQRRLAKAKVLLASGEEHLCDIALSSGFSSQAHMNYRLNEELGVSPKRFRDIMKSASKPRRYQ